MNRKLACHASPRWGCSRGGVLLLRLSAPTEPTNQPGSCFTFRVGCSVLGWFARQACGIWLLEVRRYTNSLNKIGAGDCQYANEHTYYQRFGLSAELLIGPSVILFAAQFAELNLAIGRGYSKV